MIKWRASILILFTVTSMISACSNAKPDFVPPFSANQLMTAQDLMNSAYSNLSITNAAGAAVTASGLYIAGFDVNDCSVCTGAVVGGNNVMGTFAEPIAFDVGQSINIGQNYLYNIIYNGLSVVRNTISAPCNLPGCSWPGDSGAVTGWCLSMGVMSRNSAYTSSHYTNGSNTAANIVPLSEAITSIGFNYNYNLVDPNTLTVGGPCLGPIVCNDQTLTCISQATQSQRFQAY